MRFASRAGPKIDPIPKNPSTVFMMEVCSDVDVTMSPIKASAPVLKTPIAMPDRPINTQKYTKELPARNR